MTNYRIGVVGLGQRIAHVLAGMKEVGWAIDVVAHVDPAPVGAPILATAGIPAGRPCLDIPDLLRQGPAELYVRNGPRALMPSSRSIGDRLW